ncbi:putative bifunctional diguanylate cyclase/phosphodiesterase [Aquibium oceanicum]|uniref:Diguanylate phosphodiesterase n=1 Tax=Aquibium oceanicum TaxID=1670800 RepID=A0A1L3SWR7_9HYPH|nr:EAL domain-containing protein [Aquibium oceanicum]APH73820.1 diguanylate phosphodiesterase [Aquibium oceanicum]
MRKIKKDDIPVDIYIPFVESLFRDGFTLSVGLVAQTLLVILCYWKTSDPLYLLVAVGMAAVGVMRLRNIRRYRNMGKAQTGDEAWTREKDYVLYGSMHGFMLGLFCFVGIYLAHDPFAEIAAVSVTLASATAIAGRNYGSPRMVMIFIMTMTWPISLGFILRGDWYHLILGCMAFPFFFAIRRFADLVREVLFAALSEEKKANRLAQRFNRALNTMSHGLIMLGGEGRVIVANAEAAELMRVDNPEKLIGRSLKALLLRGAAGGLIDRKDCSFVEAQLSRALRDGCGRKLLVDLTDGRHLEFSAREGSDDLGVITFEDVTQRVHSEEKIRTMARFDSLTGLANRAYFHELVTEQMSGGDRDRLCALAIFDIDDFKSINDTLGHPVGDGLIYAISERLSFFADENTRVSRFGGDEFVIYFDRVEDELSLGRILDGLFEGLKEEVDVAGHVLRIQVSAGAVLRPIAISDFDDMVVKADLALYKAKEFGKNGWRLFESTMDAAFRERQMLKSDLRNAVAAAELRVVYQPIVGMETMRIASCEALCRWHHPELGNVSPAVFIPLAEEMGIITEISRQVLIAACRECRKWPAPIGVSVNLSARDFRDADIVDTVRHALEETGLEPSRLEIEVTETAVLDDKSSTRDYLEEIRSLGVRIALDDFGTGYSGLSYLHTLPLDKVKIDRSFLQDITTNERSLELLKGVVSLSRQLGLTVTIEGVETFEQLKILAVSVHPDLLQGFLFGSALSASGIETMASSGWPFAEDLKRARLAAAS